LIRIPTAPAGALESPQQRGRHRVVLVEVPADFQPEAEWEIPERFTFAETLEERITRSQGIAVTRDFNRRQLATGVADGRWAVLVFSPKPKRRRVAKRNPLRENATP